MLKKLVWIVIFAGIIVFAVPKLLEQLSIVIETMQTDTADEAVDAAIILPPVIDWLPVATNSAQVVVSGFADQADRVEVFVNGISKKETRIASSDQSFSVSVPLFQGENSISLVSYDSDGNSSEKSQPVTIRYNAEGPELIVDSPADDEEFRGDDEVEIRGITDPDATVTVNGRWVRVQHNGTFFYSIRLQEGENELTIEAKGPGGNVSTVTRRVRYTK